MPRAKKGQIYPRKHIKSELPQNREPNPYSSMNKTNPNPESNRVREENVLNGLLRLLYIILIEIEFKKSVAIIIPCLFYRGQIQIPRRFGSRYGLFGGSDPDTGSRKKNYFFLVARPLRLYPPPPSSLVTTFLGVIFF